MDASALNTAAGARWAPAHPTPLLRLASDERLVALTRRGHQPAFEALVARYQARLLSFCRHMLASREDAEDVLQEVFAAGYNAMIADERPINVRPWLYRIARNRSLNHLRRATAIGQDSMDVHMADNGTTTDEKVHRREEFRQLMADVQTLPETQRTALLLREIDALRYEQIAEAMDTTIPSVKSLLVRARVSLAEAAEARALSCEDVRGELGEVAEGIKQRLSPPVRRHLRGCERCAGFRKQLRQTNRALAMLFPVGPLLFFKKAALAQLGTTASAGGAAVGTTAATGAAAAGGAGALSAGVTAVATKTAAGLAAAAIVTTAAVEVQRAQGPHPRRAAPARVAAAPAPPPAPVVVASRPQPVTAADPEPAARKQQRAAKAAAKSAKAAAKAASAAAQAVGAAPAPASTAPAEGSDTSTLPAQPTPPPSETAAAPQPSQAAADPTAGGQTGGTPAPIVPGPQPAAQPDGSAPPPGGSAPPPDGSAPPPDGSAPPPDGSAPQPDGSPPPTAQP